MLWTLLNVLDFRTEQKTLYFQAPWGRENALMALSCQHCFHITSDFLE